MKFFKHTAIVSFTLNVILYVLNVIAFLIQVYNSNSQLALFDIARYDGISAYLYGWMLASVYYLYFPGLAILFVTVVSYLIYLIMKHMKERYSDSKSRNIKDI